MIGQPVSNKFESEKGDLGLRDAKREAESKRREQEIQTELAARCDIVMKPLYISRHLSALIPIAPSLFPL